MNTTRLTVLSAIKPARLSGAQLLEAAKEAENAPHPS